LPQPTKRQGCVRASRRPAAVVSSNAIKAGISGS
jgi:hypothetical protein